MSRRVPPTEQGQLQGANGSLVNTGSGKCLEEFEVLQRVLVSPSRR